MPTEFTALAESSGHSFAFIIGNSKSDNRKLVRLMCTQAQFFTENGEDYIFAVFGDDKRQLDYALEVVRLAGNWKATIMFYKGGRVDFWSVFNWIHCYRKALDTPNIAAHCYRVESRRVQQTDIVIKILVPCTKFNNYYLPQYHHPASFEDQFRARIKEQGLDRCPLFDFAKFQYVIWPHSEYSSSRQIFSIDP